MEWERQRNREPRNVIDECQRSGRHEFLLRERDCVKEGLHWRLAEAPASLMGTVLIVVHDRRIKIGCNSSMLRSERHPIELVEQVYGTLANYISADCQIKRKLTYQIYNAELLQTVTRPDAAER